MSSEDFEPWEYCEEDHGGGCCGMTHVYEFPDLKTDCTEKGNREAAIDGFLSTVTQTDTRHYANTGSHLYEVVLLDSQLRSGWLYVLQKAGFRRVSRFLNSNSGNICNVFHKCDTAVPRYKGRAK